MSKQKLIFINYNKIKDLTNDHIYAIEAHELGHFIAGHSNKEVADIDETEADIIGINILLKNNKLKSAQFLIERLSYDNINYKEYKLSHNIWADIKQYIK
jgi:Zn-dependent peptidase ImmA (M78 family)